MTESCNRGLAAIILAYGDGTNCQSLLTDLAQHAGLDRSRLFVVHNPSRPGEVVRIPDGVCATVIENASNLGYAEGMNVGLGRALEMEPEWLLMVTHDVRIKARDIDLLCSALAADRRYAVVGPSLSSSEGEIFSCGMTRVGHGRMGHRPASRQPGACQPWESESIDGSVMLWRASVLRQLGGFDRRFFMYIEDIELCSRAVRTGWKVGVVDSVTVRSVPGGKERRAAHAYLRTRNGLEHARSQGAQYLALEIGALVQDYWRHTPKPGGVRFGHAEHQSAARAFRRGATLGIIDFLRRRWGPPPTALLRESDIRFHRTAHKA